jgi:tubulin polyglutamylase TTLL1
VYGFDILIEDNLKPWLIEVNASPSLTASTDADRLMKMQVINDTYNVVVPNDWLEESKHGSNTSKETQ